MGVFDLCRLKVLSALITLIEGFTLSSLIIEDFPSNLC